MGSVNLLLEPVASILDITPLELARQLTLLDQGCSTRIGNDLLRISTDALLRLQ
jgi:hypothetical protein